MNLSPARNTSNYPCHSPTLGSARRVSFVYNHPLPPSNGAQITSNINGTPSTANINTNTNINLNLNVSPSLSNLKAGNHYRTRSSYIGSEVQKGGMGSEVQKGGMGSEVQKGNLTNMKYSQVVDATNNGNKQNTGKVYFAASEVSTKAKETNYFNSKIQDGQNGHIKQNKVSIVKENTVLKENSILKQNTNSFLKQNTNNSTVKQNKSNLSKLKVKDSDKKSRLPPFSPKTNQKPIPSFIAKKQEHLSNNGGENSVCVGCGKDNASHSDIRGTQVYCTRCGVKKMMDGQEIVQYLHIPKHVDMDTSTDNNKTINNEACSKLSPVLQPASQQYTELSFSEKSTNNYHCHNNQEGESESILSLSNIASSNKASLIRNKSRNMDMDEEKMKISSKYKSQKMRLKQHYEKIKAAIKTSIEQDLHELAQLELHELAHMERHELAHMSEQPGRYLVEESSLPDFQLYSSDQFRMLKTSVSGNKTILFSFDKK